MKEKTKTIASIIIVPPLASYIAIIATYFICSGGLPIVADHLFPFITDPENANGETLPLRMGATIIWIVITIFLWCIAAEVYHDTSTPKK